jgi:hypothetical protein
MANLIGIRTFSNVAANVLFTSNITLTTIGLSTPVAVNQTIKLRAWVPFSVGATGGIRIQVVVPAGGTIFLASFKVYNTVTPALITAIQVASAAFTNALAVAGTHWAEVEATVINGATAGTVDVQWAQNTSDVLTLTILRGGSMDIVKL